MREKILGNPQTFLFVFVLYCTKRRFSLQIKPQLKVEIEGGREAPKKPCHSIFFYCYPQNIFQPEFLNS